jgi:hypothetical protein
VRALPEAQFVQAGVLLRIEQISKTSKLAMLEVGVMEYVIS